MYPKGWLLSKNNEAEHEYVIRRRAYTDWYFMTIQKEDPYAVIWCGQIFKAQRFYTEEQVEEFKFHFLFDRPCDIIMLR